MIIVTGGAGFIGSNFIHQWIHNEKTPLVNVDKLTYAGNLNNLEQLENHSLYHFVKGDICDRPLLRELFQKFNPRAILHFAAETHVDRSIRHPEEFIQTNIVGTFHLLEETLAYWKHLDQDEQKIFRLLYLSTDEVYGSLTETDLPSKENSPYAPNSPYAATKASSDHLVRSYYQTYQLPAIITHSSNNFGPYQFPEKFIPLMIVNALQGKPLPIYGDGLNIRNWLYVIDHCQALRLVLAKGIPGETYNIATRNELTNREVAQTLCELMDELLPNSPYVPHSSLIEFVQDRPGHDRRYSLDSSKIARKLGWKAHEDFKANLRKTIEWYLKHSDWIKKRMSSEYHEWIKTHYTERGS